MSKITGSSSFKMFSAGNGILPWSLSSNLCMELYHTECGLEYADRLITGLLDAWFNMPSHLFREYPVQSYWFGVTVGKSSSVMMNISLDAIVLAWFIIAGNFVLLFFDN